MRTGSRNLPVAGGALTGSWASHLSGQLLASWLRRFHLWHLLLVSSRSLSCCLGDAAIHRHRCGPCLLLLERLWILRRLHKPTRTACRIVPGKVGYNISVPLSLLSLPAGCIQSTEMPHRRRCTRRRVATPSRS